MHRAPTYNSELNLVWTETEYGKELKTPKTETRCPLRINTTVVPTAHLQKNGSVMNKSTTSCAGVEAAHVISMLSLSAHICFWMKNVTAVLEKCFPTSDEI